jgi:16S rRNA (cytidine1402-2'-O)-methyltransferase
MRSPKDAKRAEPSDADAASKSTPDAATARESMLSAGTLAVVATPIGNLGDLSLRALACLRDADVVACEDTRVTAKLFSAHGVHTPMLAYHEHNAARMRPQIVERLTRGQIVALVSDAGTPLISDPGYKLVQAAIAAGVTVVAAPGPSALLTALVVSGLPSDRFFFAGFLAPRGPARRAEIRALAAIPGTLIFYESAGRLAAALEDLLAVLGDRPAAVARELTKRFEETRRGTLTELAAHYRAAEARGEIVILVGPPEQGGPGEMSEPEIDRALDRALAEYSLREAASLVAAETGLPRRLVYARALRLKGRGDPELAAPAEPDES